MRWRPSASSDVEDRRDGGVGSLGGGGLGGGGFGGGGMGIPIPIGGGIGGIVVFILFLFLNGAFSGGGGSLGGGIGDLGGGPAGNGGIASSLDPSDTTAQFVNAVTVDVQDFWTQRFQAAGKTYERTHLVLFSQATQTVCGTASSASGPFYCPADKDVYLDAGFFDELRTRFKAPGDFARAYVIAHEFGHHVQDLLGITDQVSGKQQSNPDQANDLSIRLELQADCLAGVWAHSVWAQPDQSNVESLDQTDIQSGLDAAAAVGDDRIQERSTGRIDRETWTHGSSAQRTHWFQQGFQQGTTGGCDTFSVAQP
jgi:predicted metalloprotease